MNGRSSAPPLPAGTIRGLVRCTCAAEEQIGLAGGEHVLDPVGLPVAQHDRQRVALAVGGDDGLVGLTGLAAAVLDLATPGHEPRESA